MGVCSLVLGEGNTVQVTLRSSELTSQEVLYHLTFNVKSITIRRLVSQSADKFKTGYDVA